VRYWRVRESGLFLRAWMGMFRQDRRDRRERTGEEMINWQTMPLTARKGHRGLGGRGSKKVRVGDSCMTHLQSSENDLFSSWPPTLREVIANHSQILGHEFVRRCLANFFRNQNQNFQLSTKIFHSVEKLGIGF